MPTTLKFGLTFPTNKATQSAAIGGGGPAPVPTYYRMFEDGSRQVWENLDPRINEG
jgi:hypothetical protein